VLKTSDVELVFKNFDTKKGVYARLASCDPFGNWCGHDKDKPRFFHGKSTHKKRPVVLETAKTAAQQFYHTPGKFLRGLSVVRSSKRKIRTESREAIASVIQVLMHYLDLATLRFVMPMTDGGLFCPTMKFISKAAGIGEKRLSRAIALLKKAGYISINERYKKDGDDFIGLSAVKCVRPQLFLALGISLKDLKKQRQHASKALRAKERARRQKEHSLLISKLSFSQGLAKNIKENTNLLSQVAKQSGNDADLSVVAQIKKLWSKVHNPQYH
jgi:hypothetical protein